MEGRLDVEHVVFDKGVLGACGCLFELACTVRDVSCDISGLPLKSLDVPEPANLYLLEPTSSINGTRAKVFIKHKTVLVIWCRGNALIDAKSGERKAEKDADQGEDEMPYLLTIFDANPGTLDIFFLLAARVEAAFGTCMR